MANPSPTDRLTLWVSAAALSAAVAATQPAPAGVLVWTLVAAPLLEEFVFRAGLQAALTRRGLRPVWGANALTAGVFAAAHAGHHPPALAAATALPALLIGALWGRTRRLGDAVAAHAACNALWLGGLSHWVLSQGLGVMTGSVG